jgi:hypothetical protein
MVNYFTSKALFLLMLFVSMLLVVLTEPMFAWLHKGSLNMFEASMLEPIFYCVIGIGGSTIPFLFLSQNLFQKWFKKIFVWFVPLGLFITFSTDVYGGIPQPGRGDTAGLFSMLLVVVTLIFILVQRFYYKNK